MKIQPHKTKKVVAPLVFLGTAFAVLAGCLVAANPPCPNLPATRCPDGSTNSQGQVIGSLCTSEDHKELATDVGESSGKDGQPSSGKCNYSCSYPDGELSIFCGSLTNTWNGTKPGPNDCPSGSGSGGGGEGE
jgi:hypothetical protein